MLIFAGLGNPGAQYAHNRHNIGFMALDSIAKTGGFAPFRSRFQGLASEGTIGGARVILLKPTTFMNESGRAVGEALRFFKLGLPDLVVFHDELDLEPGRVRVKTGGGNAGHNGLRSITALCGNDYRRVRLGIGHPGDKSLVYNYVLGDFDKAERPWVSALCEAIAASADALAGGDDVGFQNRIVRAMTAAGVADTDRSPRLSAGRP